MRMILDRTELTVRTPSVVAYKQCETQVQVDIVGPSDSADEPQSGDTLVHFYVLEPTGLDVEDEDWPEAEGAEFSVPLDDLMKFLTKFSERKCDE